MEDRKVGLDDEDTVLSLSHNSEAVFPACWCYWLFSCREVGEIEGLVHNHNSTGYIDT